LDPEKMSFTLLWVLTIINIINNKHISGVMVSVWLIVGSGRGGSNHYANGICNFSSKQASLRSQSKDWLAQNQDNVSE